MNHGREESSSDNGKNNRIIDDHQGKRSTLGEGPPRSRSSTYATYIAPLQFEDSRTQQSVLVRRRACSEVDNTIEDVPEVKSSNKPTVVVEQHRLTFTEGQGPAAYSEHQSIEEVAAQTEQAPPPLPPRGAGRSLPPEVPARQKPAQPASSPVYRNEASASTTVDTRGYPIRSTSDVVVPRPKTETMSTILLPLNTPRQGDPRPSYSGISTTQVLERLRGFFRKRRRRYALLLLLLLLIGGIVILILLKRLNKGGDDARTTNGPITTTPLTCSRTDFNIVFCLEGPGTGDDIQRTLNVVSKMFDMYISPQQNSEHYVLFGLIIYGSTINFSVGLSKNLTKQNLKMHLQDSFRGGDWGSPDLDAAFAKALEMTQNQEDKSRPTMVVVVALNYSPTNATEVAKQLTLFPALGRSNFNGSTLVFNQLVRLSALQDPREIRAVVVVDQIEELLLPMLPLIV